MNNLVLITPEGLIVSNNKLPKVEKHQEEEPLHVKAAREAAMQSTPLKHS
jgi:hypothetical protein